MSLPSTVTDPSGQRLDLQIARQRQRPVTSFGTLMRRGISQGAATIQSHTGAGYMMPGGAVLSAAINKAGSLVDQLPPPTASVGPMLSGGGGGLADHGGGGHSGGDGLPNPGGSAGDLMAATERLHQRNQEFSLKFLSLQDKFSTEAQHTSFVSNIMKKRDQTLTNVIQNVR